MISRVARVVLLGLILFPLGGLCRDAAPRKLNIVSIVTDDQGHWTIGAYGNRDSRTPNMDRLAAEGALFRNAFVSTPVCSPSRAAFLTGFYGTEVGITDWITPAQAEAGVGLPPDTITWPAVLHQQGYATALIGKWHLGALDRTHPTLFGFDYFFGFRAGGVKPMDPTLETNGEPAEFVGPCSDILTSAAIRFVRTNHTRPFALLLHFREPHLPYGPMPDEDTALFKDREVALPEWPDLDRAQVQRWMREYYASIHAVDRNLGRLLKTLDELRLADKTIVLFTSDHGYNLGHHGLHTKGNATSIAGPQKGKRRPNMFEESIRVPLIIRWPGVVRGGTELTETVSNIDTLPTVLGMLGVAMPAGFLQRGTDFSPLLRGEKMRPHPVLFGQYDLHNGGSARLRMVRTDEWKLVRDYRTNGVNELYNLKRDPGETVNLFDDPKFKWRRSNLQTQLNKWMRSISDPLSAKRESARPGAASEAKP